VNAPLMGKGLSVIMPALNEEDNVSAAIQETLAAFEACGIDGEVIVINDGSSDKTGERAQGLAVRFPGKVRVIEHELPKGIGASFWDGVDAAAADAVVMLPGDNENDPLEILRYFRLLEHVDLVIPFIYNRQARPGFRNILSLFYRLIINMTFVVNFNYTNGTVLYRKSILKELSWRSSGFFFQTDILIRSVKKGYLFAEVPYKLGIRKKGSSKAISFPSFLQVAAGYIRLFRDFYLTPRRRTEFRPDSQTAARRNGEAKIHG